MIAQLRGHGDIDHVARGQARHRRVRQVQRPAQGAGVDQVTIRRYREAARLNEKVEQLETALERRSVIERARGS